MELIVGFNFLFSLYTSYTVTVSSIIKPFLTYCTHWYDNGVIKFTYVRTYIRMYVYTYIRIDVRNNIHCICVDTYVCV